MSSATAQSAQMKKMSAVTPSKTMRGHKKLVRGVAHLPGGQHIITCSLDGSLRLWDLKSSTQTGNDWRDERVKLGIWTMALSPKGKTVASGSEDGTMRLWDVNTRKVIAKWQGHAEVVDSVCWSPNGEQIVSGSRDGTARVWHVESGRPVKGLNPVKTGHESVLALDLDVE
ncbi:WD40 repeat-like protein [Suillus weaverae]|nr:WD40 repeat-like protein [Suillus weaverae]